jgi:hypothetical protein
MECREWNTILAQGRRNSPRPASPQLSCWERSGQHLASKEASIDDDWKQAIIEAHSEDGVKAEVINDIIPVPGTVGYGTVGRTLRTPFLDEWSSKGDEARRSGEHLWAEIPRESDGDSVEKRWFGRERPREESARS